MSGRRFFIFAMLCVAFSLPVSATDDHPSKDGRWTGDIAYPMSSRVGMCLAHDNAKFVAAWLYVLPGSHEEKQLLDHNGAKFSLCFTPNLASFVGWDPVYNTPLIRTKLIRFLIQHDVPVIVTNAPSEKLVSTWYRDSASSTKAADGSASLLNELGFCIVRSDWADARALALASEDSPAETQATDKIIPFIGGCIPTGMKLHIDRSSLRGIVEEAIFHGAGGVTAHRLYNVPAKQWRTDNANG